MDVMDDTMRDQMDTLQTLYRQSQALSDCKTDLLAKRDMLDKKQHLYEEVVAERQRLNKEKRTLLDMLNKIQQDMDSITDIESNLHREQQDLLRQVETLQNDTYEPLHDNVNALRIKQGLPKLPSFQQELEAHMAHMLEQRRQTWQQEQSPSSSSSSRRRR
ncbi:hypothetical protein BCR43DRAFT_196784 [Syncephalastrum racemosum]|uniref:Uncharacterized protein n=1 Tax=Syncephalastrum racemosum TaxID=13706 RepID=A0A1X2HIW3_SYNRA|nr:hypothetical protein BCR43DRAFT_196784 [Syncephalastrum racemosum]